MENIIQIDAFHVTDACGIELSPPSRHLINLFAIVYYTNIHDA